MVNGHYPLLLWKGDAEEIETGSASASVGGGSELDSIVAAAAAAATVLSSFFKNFAVFSNVRPSDAL